LQDRPRGTSRRRTPLRRIGSPADVDRLIPDLLEVTKLVTGACFRVDGGRILGVDS
jgi:pteridine reductase